MTKYDILVDSMVTELFNHWEDGVNGEQWNEEEAKSTVKRILDMIVEYQSEKPIKTWRATD